MDAGERTEQARALEQAPRALPIRKGSVGKLRGGLGANPVVVVTILACRNRLIDDDNLAAGFKPLRDAIAETLGIDDSDPRVRWEPRQIESTKEETIVRIATL